MKLFLKNIILILLLIMILVLSKIYDETFYKGLIFGFISCLLFQFLIFYIYI